MRFASDISILWLLPWAVICVFLAIWFYKNTAWISELSKRKQFILKALRTSILFILGILLIGLILEASNYRDEKPIIISLIDNSSSLKNYADSSVVKKNISAYQEKLRSDLSEEFEIVEMTVGTEGEYSSDVELNEPVSDLSKGFEKIHNDFYSRNIGGVIFVSDGNFNTGNNPVYAAEKLNFTPIFSLGVGDTVPKRDHYIKNVAANEVTFYKNKFPVEVDIEALKMGKTSATVSIQSEGKTLATQNVSYKNGKHDFEHLTFLLEANKIGFHAYKVVVTKASNEFNYKNNERIFYIEVIDSRSKILILSGAPHPDIAALKEVLEYDQNIEIESKLVKDWDKDLSKIDMIIWHEPGVGFENAINSKILAAQIPVLYIIGPNTNSTIIYQLNAGMTINASSQTDDMQGILNSGFNQFDLSENVRKGLEFFPPLKTKFGTPKLSGGAEIAIYQRLGSIKKNEPLLYFNKRGKNKYGVLFGEGVWRWKMNDFVRNKNFDAFTEIFQKSTQYLMIQQNKYPLQVSLPKRFSKDEEVVLNASFLNESLEKITKPKIKLALTNNKGLKSNYQFAVSGDMYKLVLGKLNPGKYSWFASTSYNGKSYNKSGVFVVEDIALENLDTYANHTMLNLMSSRTKGQFNPLKDYSKTIDLIKKREDITSVSIKESSFNDLIDYKILFFILLVLAGLEWFLRRWFGGY